MALHVALVVAREMVRLVFLRETAVLSEQADYLFKFVFVTSTLKTSFIRFLKNPRVFDGIFHDFRLVIRSSKSFVV